MANYIKKYHHTSMQLYNYPFCLCFCNTTTNLKAGIYANSQTTSKPCK